jgi:hypothetical protein
MKYDEHYARLIERAKTRNLPGYAEQHHIVPKCVGGTDSKENLVKLTPEEHYTAHQLLVKLYPESKKLAFAANMMTVNSRDTKRNNKLYGWLKKRISAARTGTKNAKWAALLKGNTYGKANKGKKNPGLSLRNIGNQYASGKSNLGSAAACKINMIGNTYGKANKGKSNTGVTAANLKRLAEGTHPSQNKIKCEHCSKIIGASMYARWHGNNCKLASATKELLNEIN